MSEALQSVVELADELTRHGQCDAHTAVNVKWCATESAPLMTIEEQITLAARLMRRLQRKG